MEVDTKMMITWRGEVVKVRLGDYLSGHPLGWQMMDVVLTRAS